MKRFLMAVLFIIPLAGQAADISAPRTKGPTSFAVIVDKATYDHVKTAVDAYRTSIEKDGLPSYLVVADWKNAEEVRTVIRDLAARKPVLEGVVFVGDIPIPMLRNAQHMTTAFKMDPEMAWKRSSVPTDRIYDDFDLKCTFLKQDSTNHLLNYYSLDPDSPQRVEREIYSGRILPPLKAAGRYAVLEKYLLRIAKQKEERVVLDHALTFTGHGYNSESLSAWEGAAIALREQFPGLYRPGGVMESYNFAMSDDMKEILMTALQNPALDLALFHAHGADDTQYLLNSPKPFTADQNLEAAKKFIRGKLQQAKRRKKSVDEALAYYVKTYGVPREWFANALSDSVVKADSIADARLDIYLEDIALIAPQPRFIMFDECFNGNFTADDYVAAKYVFGGGKTVAAVANSVNVLQDQWANENLGLLNYGVRVGAWHRSRRYLESHIIGDPTFRYAAAPKRDLNAALVLHARDIAYWRSLLAETDISLRALAVEMLFQNLGARFEKELVALYHTDASFQNRLTAVRCLASLRSPAFEAILPETGADPYEYIRRLTAMWMGEVGKQEYLPQLVAMTLSDPSERVQYHARESLERISPSKALAVVTTAIRALPPVPSTEKLLAAYTRSLTYGNEKIFGELIPNSTSDTLTVKKQVNVIRTFRAYNYHEAVPTLVAIAGNTKAKPQIRAAAIEAMGWYSLAHDRAIMIDACKKIAASDSSPEAVRNAAVQTVNRLVGGPNEALTP